MPVLNTMDFQPFGQACPHTQPSSWYLLPSGDPELNGAQKQTSQSPGAGGKPLRGSPRQSRWGDTEWRGARHIWERTDEGQLPPGGGTREGVTKDLMGKMALKGFHEEERQLDQSPYQHVSKTPRSGSCCDRWLSGLSSPPDWELWKGIPPSRAKSNQPQPREEGE